MKILLCLSLIFSFGALAECRFRSDTFKKIYSLSGPVTVALRELRLLNRVTGISIFNPVNRNDFKGEVLPGGVFLSSQSLASFSGSLVFYDESRELHKIFSGLSSLQSIEVITRGLSPVEVSVKVIKILEPFLLNCEAQLTGYLNRTRALEEELARLIPAQMSVVFFLGEFRQGKKPELVIANDGVVKLLRERNLIRTYPSELAYPNWSSKVMSELPKGTVFVGVKDSNRDGEKSLIRTSEDHENLVFSGSLVPGISQLEAWVYWAKERRGLSKR